MEPKKKLKIVLAGIAIALIPGAIPLTLGYMLIKKLKEKKNVPPKTSG
jgi:hypothetical protein